MNGNFAWGLAWFVAKIPSHSDHSSYKDRANPVCFFELINRIWKTRDLLPTRHGTKLQILPGRKALSNTRRKCSLNHDVDGMMDRSHFPEVS